MIFFYNITWGWGGGPQCIVDKSSKKILARGRTPTHPFLAMPGFSDHLYPHPLPYWSFFAQCNGWFSMFSNCYPKVKLNNALKGGKLLLEAATSSSQRKKSPGGQIRRIRQITRRLPCDWQICFRPTLADNMLRLVALFTYANGLINDRNSVHYKQSKSRHDVFLK